MNSPRSRRRPAQREIAPHLHGTPSLLLSYLDDDDFLLAPLPQSPVPARQFALIYSGVSINLMAKPARQRETITPGGHLQLPPDVHRGVVRFSITVTICAITGLATIEGGDILVIGNGYVMIGLSERTTQGIEVLASALFRSDNVRHRDRRRTAA